MDCSHDIPLTKYTHLLQTNRLSSTHTQTLGRGAEPQKQAEYFTKLFNKDWRMEKMWYRKWCFSSGKGSKPSVSPTWDR